MTTFDSRKDGFENKFAHDAETTFKITARRNKLLGLWIAGHRGLNEAQADAYAKEVIAADFEEAGDEDVVRKLLKDIATHNLPITEKQLREEMARLLVTAREQVTKG